MFREPEVHGIGTELFQGTELRSEEVRKMTSHKFKLRIVGTGTCLMKPYPRDFDFFINGKMYSVIYYLSTNKIDWGDVPQKYQKACMHLIDQDLVVQMWAGRK